MDVLVTPPSSDYGEWKAQIIEFNGLGAHRNTGSDLFHWVTDHDILCGKPPGVTVRSADDWEEGTMENIVNREKKVRGDTEHEDTESNQPPPEALPEATEPDWLVLEYKLPSIWYSCWWRMLTRFGGVIGRQRIIASGRTEVASDLIMRDTFAVEQRSEPMVLKFKSLGSPLKFDAGLNPLALETGDLLL
ncbi:uncharacterized protein J7T54_001951 [Emericellopsis cladophorae]|uniref:Uncharacterized protein n=1 Tax=Emericellopsis cladophorae TaxID=2686198 RepID=A0A9P9XXU7_9HYPO|nr:uncharacterized protein J7T54_001951 [Emericellopsis cladophorae]KAI6779863.1 hypothetical protein J7T54_001951 [Emericellopsis cladophorae]